MAAMASKACFLTAAPLAQQRGAARLIAQRMRMCSSGPQAPEGFTPPTPRKAYIRPDALPRILGGGVGLLLRGGSGATVAGYTVRFEDGKFVESSKLLPETRPAEPLVLYAFPACPFCRKVYEALCALDLDVLVKPCPKDGKVYRPYVEETFGKAQFPYLYDPNSGFSGYESGEIISFLYKTYGSGDMGIPLAQSSAGTVTAGLAALAEGGAGRQRAAKVVTAPEPLTLWGYEPSPFCRVVSERLTELEIPYYWKTTSRGSPTRAALKDLTGTVQIPYVQDPNTGVEMFESQDIVEYLNAVYGPDAKGAVEVPTAAQIASAHTIGVEGPPPVAAEKEASLDPKAPVDPKLEEYCADSPEADECRTYDT